MATKRQNGAGSVYQRKDGRWVAQVKDPITGKLKVRYSSTKNKADQLLRDMLQRMDQGTTAADSQQTLGEYVKFWIDHRALRRRAPGSVYEYTSRLHNHILPAIGYLKISRITQTTIEDFLDSLKVKGLSKATIKGVRTTLGAVFTDAVRDRIVAYNPVRSAEMPIMNPKPRKPVPTTSDIKQLLNDIKDVRQEPDAEIGRILTLCIFTGARIGEILTMQWNDIDVDNQVWKLSRTATRDVNGNQTIGMRTKTGEVREVLLADEAIAAITQQRSYLLRHRMKARIWTEQDLVFPSDVGTLKDAKNLRKQCIKAFPQWKYSFHSIRHWFASQGLQSGVGVVQVARLLGHRSTATTQEVYGHLMAEGSEAVIKSVQDAIGDQ